MLEPGGDPDLLQEAVGPEGRDQLPPEQLEGHGAVVSEIVGQPDRRHPAPAELALDPVAVGQRRRELGRGGHAANRPSASARRASRLCRIP